MTIFFRFVSLFVDICFCSYLIVTVSIFLFKPLELWFCITGQKINGDILITALIIIFVYCFLLGRMTFGKLLCYLKVVDAKTLKSANFFQIIKRNLIVLSTFGISYLWLLFSKGECTLHDKLSNTTVIRDKT